MRDDALAKLSKAPGEVELRKVERLLSHVTEHHNGCKHLLNALLVEAERYETATPIIHAIQLTLASMMGDRTTGKKLQDALNDLVRSARLARVIDPRIGLKINLDDKGNTKSYTLGEGMIEFVQHLRFDLGLSALYICRHMRGYHGAPTPPGVLLALVAGLLYPPADATDAEANHGVG